MTLRSKYRIFSCIVLLAQLIAVPFLTIISAMSTKLFLTDPKKIFVLAFPLTMAYTVLILIYHLRYKWNIVEINDVQVRISKFFGLGREIIINYSEIKAIPSWEHVKIGSGDLILIESNGLVVTEISDYTYSNYHDLNSKLQEKLKFEEYRRRHFRERIRLALV